MMIHIGEKEEGSVTTLREVSEDQAISVKYLEQLVSSLTAAGLLLGHRGARGGYSLKRPMDQITAGDIIRACEGSTAPVACLEDGFGVCPRQDVCETLGFWKGLDEAIDGYLDSVKLSDLVAQSLEAKKRMADWVPPLAEDPC